MFPTYNKYLLQVITVIIIIIVIYFNFRLSHSSLVDETEYQEWLRVGFRCAAGDFLVKVRDLHSNFCLSDSYLLSPCISQMV